MRTPTFLKRFLDLRLGAEKKCPKPTFFPDIFKDTYINTQNMYKKCF